MTTPAGHRVFAMPVRVYFQDTDAGGVVFHGIYLNFLERARTEWLRGLGFALPRLMAEFGVLFVVRNVAIEYHRPARLDDTLQVSVAIARAGGAQLSLLQDVTRDRKQIAAAQVGLACVSTPDLKAARMPPALRAACTHWSTGTMTA